MSVSRTSRLFILPLILAGAATPVLAQDAADSGPRAASFLASPAKVSLPAFSGLAAPAVPPPQPPEPAPLVAVEPPAPAAPQPTPVPSAPVQAAPVTVAVAAPLSPRPPELLPKRDLVLLQGDSPESLGLQNADSLGADMWKGTSRTVADSLLSMAGVTASPVLNRLLLRLLATAATPPTGDEAPGAAGLTALRTQKLIALGDAPTAWGVASHAGPRIIDDLSVHDAAAVALAFGADDVCPRLADLAKARGGADWQKELFVCQLRADPDAAKAAIPGLRAENDRDDILLQIVEKSVLGEGKSLPTQLTPLTPARLEVLRMAGSLCPAICTATPISFLPPLC